ncbi:MAG: hypothetical protein J4F40_18655 [Alphaproteobacteria bacterium]|nr:hypothetical protein [Alphaproteobacteria bacterium]
MMEKTAVNLSEVELVETFEGSRNQAFGRFSEVVAEAVRNEERVHVGLVKHSPITGGPVVTASVRLMAFGQQLRRET